jgi:soluble lytic murein transglycosylase-like protein
LNGAALVGDLPWWRGYAPGELLEALVMQESGGNPRARRYEPHQDTATRSDARSDGDVAGQDDGPLEDDASYGLIQILGSNVRRLVGAPPATPLNFGFLFDPALGLGFGLMILKLELAYTHGHVERALARYNGGPTGDTMVADSKGGFVLRRQEYVDGVARWIERVHSDRKGTV